MASAPSPHQCWPLARRQAAPLPSLAARADRVVTAWRQTGRQRQPALQQQLLQPYWTAPRAAGPVPARKPAFAQGRAQVQQALAQPDSGAAGTKAAEASRTA